jgi:hypothetical protein
MEKLSRSIDILSMRVSELETLLQELTVQIIERDIEYQLTRLSPEESKVYISELQRKAKEELLSRQQASCLELSVGNKNELS